MSLALSNKSFKALAETLVVLFVGLVSVIANVSGLSLILFPEIAALTEDVITRPRGHWAARPSQLVITPTLTAILGLYLTRTLSYSALSMFLVVGLSLLIIRLTKSTVAPAISAGLLPMVLNERSWLYPMAIFLGTAMLATTLLIWRHAVIWKDAPTLSDEEHSSIVENLEAAPHDPLWAPALMLFVLVLGAAAEFTGLRLLLFPPLIVMAYELFGHPEVPGWMKRPTLFPIACLLTATLGLLAERNVHPVFLASTLTVLCSIGVLRLFKMHMPPALAVGLLPFVMTAPDYKFPLSVVLGTASLSVYFFLYKRLRLMPAKISQPAL